MEARKRKVEEILPEQSPKGKNVLAISSLVAGFIALVALFVEWKIGMGLGLVGLILGIIALKSEQRKWALVGIVLNGLVFIAPIVILLYTLITLSSVYSQFPS
ncbi:hypothetical protein [Thermoflavimicrobium dichotomicum]|uniref:DUF4190 domain-containing protein n=1 Tax=Thermoflavimicrobium dichotomicum TaxID=46223 RepID=A0A1I3MCS6_9BACL|nr:hypothetical protein [Thermoflavimicrobium dichotomicum]SFI94783.1 hypothetical protein SAMN05421852_1035 [Thermoflavimicrobium dichotomicum]